MIVAKVCDTAILRQLPFTQATEVGIEFEKCLTQFAEICYGSYGFADLPSPTRRTNW